MDAELIPRHLDEFLADVALERLLQVIAVAEQVGRGHQRPSRHLLRDISRREVAHFEVAALQGDELGALLEQRVAPEGLELEVVFDRGAERLIGLGTQILLR